jgi:S-DNA-T family DNA segregation ATPase FtsK/SpoIIIE
MYINTSTVSNKGASETYHICDRFFWVEKPQSSTVVCGVTYMIGFTPLGRKTVYIRHNIVIYMVELAAMKEQKRKRRTREQMLIDLEPAPRSISSEATRGVISIFITALALFLIIAEFGGGGVFGSIVYTWLNWLLGVGYALLPLSFIMIAILIFKSFEKKVGGVQWVSLFIFLVSGLSLISVAFRGRGGVIGENIASPLLASVDTTTTVLFLLAFIVASLVVAFDVHLGKVLSGIQNMFSSLWTKDSEQLGEAVEKEPVITAPLMETEALPQAQKMSHDEHFEEETPKKARMEGITKMFSASESDDGFPISMSDEAYEPPPLSILAKNKGKPEVGDVKANMNVIKRTLMNFGIDVEMDEASIGPTVTRYAIKPAEGVRLSKIVALQSNLELALAASPVRIEAPIPGKSLVGIEVPNIARTTLGLGPLVSDEGYTKSDKPLLIAMGRLINGQPLYADLAKMPHMLVAGTTGAGKSVTIHDFVVSLLYRCGPNKLRFIMVDPKRVELTLYNSIPHLLTPVITDAKKAILALKWLAKEMDRRYNVLETHKVRDIASYHENIVKKALEKAKGSKQAEDGETEAMPEAMPYIVLIIDELADIMQTYPRELESGIVRLAQMSRAVGIHLILSTQRPSVKVITGLIKANVPTRVALQVASQIDSRTILDIGGAEKLLGAGDMLFLSGEMGKPRRVQASYISETEVKKVVAHLAKGAIGTLNNEIDLSDHKAEHGGGMDAIFSSMENSGEDESDELYAEAKATILQAGKASTSYLQRKLGIGYARAARLMDILEERGVIGAADGAKPRDVIGAGNADELVKQAEAMES